jgi:hypothetical protein
MQNVCHVLGHVARRSKEDAASKACKGALCFAGLAPGLQNLNSEQRAHYERAKKENERMKAELLRLRQELREKDGTITSLQRSVADALKQGRVPDFLTEKAIKVKSSLKQTRLLSSIILTVSLTSPSIPLEIEVDHGRGKRLQL